MSLPQHNPIDFGWFNKGVALDHTSTIRFFCECCGVETSQEQFKLVVGQVLGFGTPFFVQPFMKRQSTKGKIGGTRGLITQCTVCDSLWPFDHTAQEVLAAAGISADGLISETHIADYEKRKAEESSATTTEQNSKSKAKKLD